MARRPHYGLLKALVIGAKGQGVRYYGETEQVTIVTQQNCQGTLGGHWTEALTLSWRDTLGSTKSGDAISGHND